MLLRYFETVKNFNKNKIISISLVQLNLPINQKLNEEQLLKKYNLILDIVKNEQYYLIVLVQYYHIPS